MNRSTTLLLVSLFMVFIMGTILAFGIAAIDVHNADAAAPKYPCVFRHRVAKIDTIRSIATRYQIQPWDLVAANKYNIIKPNYPIFLNDILCIPAPLGSTKQLPAWVLDQAPAWFFARQSGQKLYLTGYNFPTGQNYFVITSQKGDKSGDKIGKVKVVKKVRFDKVINLEKGYTASSVCLKNQTYDTKTCVGVYR
jgi:hypothetical protein